MHEVAPGSLKLPGPHRLVHAIAAVAVLYRPASQFEHTPAPALENLPGVHAENLGTVAPFPTVPGQKYPASQRLVHTVPRLGADE